MPAVTNNSARLKGNPASHRMNNPRRKDRCARAHVRTEATKNARRASEALRAEATRLSGTSPWAEARKARSVRRSAA